MLEDFQSLENVDRVIEIERCDGQQWYEHFVLLAKENSRSTFVVSSRNVKKTMDELVPRELSTSRNWLQYGFY